MQAISKEINRFSILLIGLVVLSTLTLGVLYTSEDSQNDATIAQVEGVATEETIETAELEVITEDDKYTYILDFEPQETTHDFLKRTEQEFDDFSFATEEFDLGNSEKSNYIVAMNGHQPDSSQFYWSFLINGEPSQVGIDEYEIQAEDVITFEVEALQF